jgi:hypothetical protein
MLEESQNVAMREGCKDCLHRFVLQALRRQTQAAMTDPGYTFCLEFDGTPPVGKCRAHSGNIEKQPGETIAYRGNTE